MIWLGGRFDPVARLRDGSLPLYWGPTTLHSDPPDKLLGKTALSATLLADIGPVLSKTTRELIIVYAGPVFTPLGRLWWAKVMVG